MRQLLNHTSGLPDYSKDPELFAGIVKNRVWQPRELVAMAERHPQLFAPGSAWWYSNTNYIVAGLLIEAVTGHPLARELDRRIFSPCTWTTPRSRSGTRPSPATTPTDTSRPRPYPTADGQPLDVTGYNPSHAWAAGAIVSNAADLSHFYRALMAGGCSPRPAAGDEEDRRRRPHRPNSTFRYGLGLERVNDTCGVNWGHGGAIFGYQASPTGTPAPAGPSSSPPP